MRKFPTKRVSSIQLDLRIGALAVVAMVLVLMTLAPSTVFAQQIPPRIYQLQEYRQIVPTPPSNADRVRGDIIKATNPRTGKVNVRALAAPEVAWPSLATVPGGRVHQLKRPTSAWESLGTVSGGQGYQLNKPAPAWDSLETQRDGIVRPLKKSR